MANTHISVIVPIFNSSNYIHKCLDSLVAQTLSEFEVILVDDGSTDNSGEICEEYASRFSNFKVIHQKNGGSAVARQTGLDAAQGKYIIVCDSDDWVEPNMYENLLIEAERYGADIAVCGYYTEYPDGRTIPRQTWFIEKDGYIDNDDFLRRGAGSSWIKLIRRSLFEKTEACYEPGINMGEDALILYKLMKGNPTVKQIRANLYHYRRLQTSGSYTNNVRMSHIYQLDFTYHWLKDNYSDEKYESIRYSKALDIAFACLRAKDTDRKYLTEFLKNELSWTRTLSHKISMKAMMVMTEKIAPLKFSKCLFQILYPFVYK